MKIQKTIKNLGLLPAFFLLVMLLLLCTPYVSRLYSQDNPASSAGDCDVTGIQKIGKGAYHRWSARTGLITYCQEVNSQFEVFTMKPDGTRVRCLTCGKNALVNTRHRGLSSWHPNAKFIVFVAENAAYQRVGNGRSSVPDIGRSHNVWIMTIDGRKFWQMTDYPENWGVIEPFFSHDGTMLHWCEEFQMEKYPQGKIGVDTHPGCYWGPLNFIKRKGEELCSWRVKYADVAFDGSGNPTLSNITTVNPPDNFTLIESNGFTPDDTAFIGTYADLSQTGGRGYIGDIFTWDLNGNNLTQLTHTPTQPEEDPYYSPDGNKISFRRLESYPDDLDEFWLMNADGSSQLQLTHFNDPSSPEYDPIAQTNYEETWNPDGTSIVFAHVSSEIKQMPYMPHIPSDCYELTFAGSCGEEN